MPVGRRVGKKQRQMGGGAWDGLCVHMRWSLVASKVRLVSMDGACIQGRLLHPRKVSTGWGVAQAEEQLGVQETEGASM